MTVVKDTPLAHKEKGWEIFTDAVISSLAQSRDNIVFLLWGSYAQKKGRYINRTRHLVLEAVHPSPLSAHRGFFGCDHFRKTNEYLRSHGKEEINW